MNEAPPAARKKVLRYVAKVYSLCIAIHSFANGRLMILLPHSSDPVSVLYASVTHFFAF
jgi:hypothetical protein